MLDVFYTDISIKSDVLYFTGFDSKLRRILQKIDYKPILFENTEEDTKWKDIYGNNVKPIKFESITEATNYKNKKEEYYGLERWEAQYLGYHFSDKPMIKFEDLKIYHIDIETTAESFPMVENPVESILCITLVEHNTGNIITFSSRKSDFKSEYNNSKFYSYNTEIEMIESFLKWWDSNIIHILSGWNISTFDIPYIVSRLDYLNPKYRSRLSPHRMVYNYKSFNKTFNKEIYKTRIFGIQQLDYLELYKKFTYDTQTSYKLDNIAMVELDEGKLDHSEYDSFKDFYESNYELFLKYNQKDAVLIRRLEHKLSLIKLAVSMAYDAKTNFSDCFSPIRIWDSIIFNYLNKRNTVIPGVKEYDYDFRIKGARVKDPTPGIYKWIVTFDLTSLYPSIIMGLNISPETLLDGLETLSIEDVVGGIFSNNNDYCLAANGAKYDRIRDGFLPILVEERFKDRKNYKNKMIDKKRELESIEEEMRKRGLL